MKRYDELLVAAAPTELRNAGQIYIPPGPRLGTQVIDVTNLKKSFGDRLLIDDLSFSIPPAGIVGIVGPYVPYFASGIFFCVPLSACFSSSFLFMTPLIH